MQQIGKTTNRYALRALAEGLQALAAKLTEAQAQHALSIAMSSLGWAADEDEAVSWARAIVALLPSQSERGATSLLATTVVYPSTAGPATEVLMDAFRERNSDAPAKQAGTAAILEWIAQRYPKQVRHPICPTPPQRIWLSGLECPQQSAADVINP